MVTAARRRLMAAAGAFVVICASAFAPGASAGLAIDQRSGGFPGSGEPLRPQKMLIGSGAIRIDDKGGGPGGRSIIVRLDRGVIWEADPKLEMYTERTFESYREQRKDAEEKRERAWKEIVKKHDEKKLTDEEFLKLLAEKHLRPDGQRVVTVRRGPASLDGEPVERVSVELNGVTQVAVWQTDKYKDQYKPPRELFDFYDKCQFLPDDVTGELRKAVTLFPVRIYADLDYYVAGGVIQTQVQGVSAWPEDPSEFAEPSAKGYKKVGEFPREPFAKKAYACPICGKPVDPATTPFPPEKDRKTGEKFFFDTQEHWEEFVNRRR